MKPDPQQPAELLTLLRQQLLLAQVRIMELEDTRDELVPRVAETASLLAATQSLAEQKTADAAHLEKVRADLQAEFEHLRHVQHVTNEALNAARTAGATRENHLLAEVDRLQAASVQLTEANRQQGEQLSILEGRTRDAEATAASRATRIQQLDLERHALKVSRSWRWTAGLRAVERWFK